MGMVSFFIEALLKLFNLLLFVAKNIIICDVYTGKWMGTWPKCRSKFYLLKDFILNTFPKLLNIN